MELMMYLGNDLIESVTINLHRLSEPGYLGQFKRVMKQKYFELIQGSNLQPEFLVVNLDAPQQDMNNYLPQEYPNYYKGQSH